MSTNSVLVTGASGYIGAKFIRQLSVRGGNLRVVALDVRAPAERLPGIEYVQCDVRGPQLGKVVDQVRPNTVVHLASIVTPPRGSTRKFEYSVDVLGTRNVLSACISTAVNRLIVSSSGAAYGYHRDNPRWLTEVNALRGNKAFAYSWHKRLVEEMLAQARIDCPSLQQTVLRLSTVLGANTSNQITALFDRPRILGVWPGDDRFVFVWDEDVARCLVHALDAQGSGVFNLAGDGAIRLKEMAQMMQKPYVRLPSLLLKGAFAILRPVRLSAYGPEHVRFLQYRPVLANDALKTQLGYVPLKSTREVFSYYLAHRAQREALHG